MRIYRIVIRFPYRNAFCGDNVSSREDMPQETRQNEMNQSNGFVDSMKHNLFVLKTLVGKDFKHKYRRSTLGVLWSVLNPLLMMVVMTAVFSFMFRFDIENYPLYLILGQILFALMSTATSTAMTSIIDAAPLLKKIKINRAIFPTEKVAFALINFLFSMIAAVGVMLWFHIFPSWSMLAFPLLVLYVLIFSLGIGMLLSALAVFFRDIVHLWSVIITAWTYMTPIFYPVSILEPWMQQVMEFNPMYHYVSYLRDIMMNSTVPGIAENVVCLGIALVVLALGVFVFKKMEKKFILYI